jgi:hypothetical protein
VTISAPHSPLSEIADANMPFVRGDRYCTHVENPPADSPNNVTCVGSPPNAAMLRCTQPSTAR